MQLSRAVSIIKQRLGFRQVGDADLIACIQDAQEHLETSYPVEPLPWFLLSERSVTSSLANEERILVPDDFMMEFEESGLWLQTPEGGEVLLRKYDADDLRHSVVSVREDAITTANRTSYGFSYALTGDYFRIFPTPTQVFNFKLIYYQRQTLLVNPADENRWLKWAPWVLIGMAGGEYAFSLRDSAAVGYFQQKKGAAMQSVTDATISRQLANRRMAMGETI